MHIAIHRLKELWAASHAELEAARKTHHMTVSGSHTIGGVDDGKGLPVVGWSTQHGDVRVAHFAGLHGLQVLTLLALILDYCRISQQKAVRIVSAAVFSYSSFFLLTLLQSLLGQPIISHGTAFMAVWILWAVISLAALLYAIRNNGDSSNVLGHSPSEAIA
jgi:hypothetical protein